MNLNNPSFHKKNSTYRFCIVRECKNTSIKTPGKLWIPLPSEINRRNTWLKVAQRDPESISNKTHLYFCEDHFDLQKDMENYMEYKLMGSIKKILMKPDCVPSRFSFHMDKKHNLSLTSDQLHVVQSTSEADSKQVCSMDASCISTSSFQEELLKEDTTPSCSVLKGKYHDKAVQVVQNNVQFCHQKLQVQPLQKNMSCQIKVKYAHKATQATISKHYRSKPMQFGPVTKDVILSPIKLISHHSSATSPMKLLPERKIKPSTSIYQTLPRRKLFFKEEKCDSNASFLLSQGDSSTNSSPSKPSSQTSTDSFQENVIKGQTFNLESTLSKIKQNPRLYIGIPAELYFIVDHISKVTELSEKQIFLCLMKVRLNRTFSQLADDFDVSLSQASKIFYSKLPIIVNILLPFIKTFTKSTIKKNLPIPFRYKYNKVNCIIDCLEIEIQKPKKAMHQALTWSEYKKTNTYKYLISCTPDGLVNFVSSGYGGRISDINLFEHCKFLDSLEPNSYILADRGFKHIEMYLKQRGFTLLRPPSVSVGTKLSKSEAKQTKEIASLRIHVERVIRRVREFAILKPHSVVNLNLLHMLDSCVITACALINLQNSLIK